MQFRGPVLIPGIRMLRYHEEIGFYEAVFEINTILKIKNRVGTTIKINKNHTEDIYHSAKVIDSFILDESNRLEIDKELPDGTWMVIVAYSDQEEYEYAIRNSTGFSFQGQFKIKAENGREYTINEGFRRMNQLSELLNVDLYIQGGGTMSTGRSEHGAAHFEVKEKGSRNKIGDLFLPTLESWRGFTEKEKLQFLSIKNAKQKLSKREKKAISLWLSLDNEKNLISSITEWNRVNKDNTRAFQMPINIKI